MESCQSDTGCQGCGELGVPSQVKAYGAGAARTPSDAPATNTSAAAVTRTKTLKCFERSWERAREPFSMTPRRSGQETACDSSVVTLCSTSGGRLYASTEGELAETVTLGLSVSLHLGCRGSRA